MQYRYQRQELYKKLILNKTDAMQTTTDVPNNKSSLVLLIVALVMCYVRVALGAGLGGRWMQRVLLVPRACRFRCRRHAPVPAPAPSWRAKRPGCPGSKPLTNSFTVAAPGPGPGPDSCSSCTTRTH